MFLVLVPEDSGPVCPHTHIVVRLMVSVVSIGRPSPSSASPPCPTLRYSLLQHHLTARKAIPEPPERH